MIVVADAGPLIYLAAIGQLELLRRLASEVLVPEAVYQEVVVAGAGQLGSDEVRAAAWLVVVRPAHRDVVEALVASGLHGGESEAIALAIEKRATWLVIDERQGRLTAGAMGLPVVGTLGVLVGAKERGDVPSLGPLLQGLRDAGMWLTQPVIDRILTDCGEPRG